MSFAIDSRAQDRIGRDAELPSYRAVSALAVASAILGLLSALALLDWAMGILPAITVLVGSRALQRIRANPDELTGGVWARLGIGLALVFLFAGWARLSYVYVTEVPEGYQRITYDDLQPDPDKPGEIIPESVKAFEGKKVFIKGYVYPSSQSEGIKELILVRDTGTCCFGGQPRLTDMVQVTLEPPLELTYSMRQHRLGGTFHVEPGAALHGLGGVVYHLRADYVR